jgi:hypothetical protein
VASDLVIVSRALADLADFLQSRQEASGRGRVILDRRVGDRRVEAVTVDRDRRRNDRRHPASAGEALMRVLGFSVVPSGVQSDGAGRRPAARRARSVGGAAAPARRAASSRRAAASRRARRRPR